MSELAEPEQSVDLVKEERRLRSIGMAIGVGLSLYGGFALFMLANYGNEMQFKLASLIGLHPFLSWTLSVLHVSSVCLFSREMLIRPKATAYVALPGGLIAGSFFMRFFSPIPAEITDDYRTTIYAAVAIVVITTAIHFWGLVLLRKERRRLEV